MHLKSGGVVGRRATSPGALPLQDADCCHLSTTKGRRGPCVFLHRTRTRRTPTQMRPHRTKARSAHGCRHFMFLIPSKGQVPCRLVPTWNVTRVVFMAKNSHGHNMTHASQDALLLSWLLRPCIGTRLWAFSASPAPVTWWWLTAVGSKPLRSMRRGASF